MTETLEYIEDYFTNALDEAGRKAFETRCETDESFAEEVALYTITRQAFREELLKEKQARWKKLKSAEAVEQPAVPNAPSAKVRDFGFKKWIPYAAAACVLAIVGVVYLNDGPSAQQLADNYVQKNIEHISREMSASKDSLETGIKLYNDKKYVPALSLFKAIDNNLPVSIDAKKYEGFVYLVTRDYDKALEQFDEVSKMDLESNPGAMLKAITLLKRNKDGDKEAAKELLTKVLNDSKAEGDEDAKKMLEKL